jgi:hypothetical protein
MKDTNAKKLCTEFNKFKRKVRELGFEFIGDQELEAHCTEDSKNNPRSYVILSATKMVARSS